MSDAKREEAGEVKEVKTGAAKLKSEAYFQEKDLWGSFIVRSRNRWGTQRKISASRSSAFAIRSAS
ncbi:hypothetical protein D3H35_26085 [Cohnella faecalis]|uniref:Uncharacterized protein n=1 Tax=Cohnella faecalis TaxID=2315694 RepID=A0A398CLX2_9BACL|nr:hypothetical protein D3H35_26085 [Cohnella faecalis]